LEEGLTLLGESGPKFIRQFSSKKFIELPNLFLNFSSGVRGDGDVIGWGVVKVVWWAAVIVVIVVVGTAGAVATWLSRAVRTRR
jgi:hypothetical protein